MSTQSDSAIKSLEDYLSEINKLKDVNDETYAKHQNTLLQVMAFKRDKLNMLKDKFPIILEALNDEGLTMDNLTYASGKLSEKFEYAGELPKQFSISFNGLPFNGKMKFIKDAGYNSKGHNKNADRLKTKATAMIERMSQKTGLKVYVNSSSLEQNKHGNNFVMINIYF